MPASARMAATLAYMFALQLHICCCFQVPEAIKRTDGMPLGKYHEGLTESEFLQHFKEMAGKNKVRWRG